ncbi:hypothetical protein [Bradyrhizobium brasilense]|uniref:Uncharacterized protein n=1 Tax=Bradyrhizobium brasilense TaxID=1419277 RepID=A0ABY8JEQ1_9BRAD|nr:hypothetical protein [Bradyrhizobium brasilense]WFU62478.1 hypothetical protein QA636_34095 [Bradyrhizobium brasilense]
MFTARVKKVVDQAKPSQKVVLIIRIDADLNTSEVATIADASQRRVYIDKFYSKLKQPLVKEVKSLTGVQIVDKLEGTNQMVLAAPAEIWRKYLAHPPAVFKSKALTVSANETEVTL